MGSLRLIMQCTSWSESRLSVHKRKIVHCDLNEFPAQKNMRPKWRKQLDVPYSWISNNFDISYVKI